MERHGASTERARKSLAKSRAIAAADRAEEAARAARVVESYTAEQRGTLERWKFRHGQFITENLWVPHIDGGKVVPFDLNPGQAKLDARVEEMRAAGLPVRIIVLKSRKQGISTYCQGVAYGYTSTREYVNGLVILDTKDKASKILDLTKKFHMLDERRAIGMRPTLESSNRLELKFGNPDFRTRELNPGLQSRLEITSADSKDPGRSGTYHFVHASEVGFWEDDGVWASAGNALMDAPDTVAFMESTANGVSGLFYETWEAAAAGRSDWWPLFLGWLDDPRCARKVTPRERDEWEWEGPQEREYAEKYGLTLEQAKFRRAILSDPKTRKAGRTAVDVFDEEYPASPELAFKSSGRQFFLARTLDALEKDPVRGKRDPIFQGTIRNRTPLEDRTPGNFDRQPIDLVFEPEEYGPLCIYENPRADCEYVVGEDVAEGLAHGDNHCAVVMRRDNRDVVAVWKTNRVTSRVAGQVACLLGWHYGLALVGIELNAHGIAASQEAARIMYPHLWHHRDVRKEGDTPQDRIGWLTTEGVRTYMLECVEFEIQAFAIGLHSPNFFAEARTFENLDGKPQARPGKHDDEIMATAVCFQMHLHSGPPRRVPEGTAAPVKRVLTPETPIQGQVPIGPGRAGRRHVGSKGLWGED